MTGTNQLRAVRHGGNLNGYGLGVIQVDEVTGAVKFGPAADIAGMLKSVPGMGIGTLLLIAGAAYWAWKEGWLKKLAGKMGQASKGGPQQ